MKKELKYTFSREAAAIQKQQLLLNDDEDAITISVEGKPSILASVDLFVKDSADNVLFHRQLGTGGNVITIANDIRRASNGAIPCMLTKGVYTIELVLWHDARSHLLHTARVDVVCESGCAGQADPCGTVVWMDGRGKLSGYDPDHMKRNHTGWYKGDFHCHTVLSDGHERLSNQMAKADLMGLDFYSATEHNLVPATWVETDLLVICGTEITTIYGHANAFGFKKRPDNLDRVCAVDSREAFLDILGQLHAERSVISINHPFLVPWQWSCPDYPLDKVDCLEIINDPTYPNNHEANQKAVRLIDAMWNDGWQICGIGGSDTHALLHEWYTPESGPSIVGDPTTHVYSEGLSQNKILEALRKCHVFVTRYIEVSFCMRENGREVLPGDAMPEPGTFEAVFRFDNVREPIHLFVIRDGVRESLRLEFDFEYRRATASYRVNWSTDAYHWMRFGAEDEKGGCIFYANPVYCCEREHQFDTFGAAIDEIA